jgi:hypothetical protein
MISIERTAYLWFKRFITARDLNLFLLSCEEVEWVAGRTNSDEHQPALLLALKSH